MSLYMFQSFVRCPFIFKLPKCHSNASVTSECLFIVIVIIIIIVTTTEPQKDTPFWVGSTLYNGFFSVEKIMKENSVCHDAIFVMKFPFQFSGMLYIEQHNIFVDLSIMSTPSKKSQEVCHFDIDILLQFFFTMPCTVAEV